jgi:uncharacterized protein
MNIELTADEARIVGCLMEKEVTTPDQYPLSLNALTNACNQKTNRDPVMELTERDVQNSIDALMRKYLVSDKSAGYGGRVTKYKQRFCNTEFGSLKFSKHEFGIVCVLLLRGPQTPGDLRQRTQRLCEFADIAAVEAALTNLMNREDGPFVVRLPRAPGSRESRYAHLFSGPIDLAALSIATDEPASRAHGARHESTDLTERVAQLEESVRLLRDDLDALRGSNQR